MDGMVKVQVLRAACCVAGADGGTESAERKIVDMLAKEVGVGEASVDAMLQRAETEPEYYQDQFRVLKANPKDTMGLLFSVAIADKELEDSEVTVLKKLAAKLDVTDQQFDFWLSEAKTFLEKSKE